MAAAQPRRRQGAVEVRGARARARGVAPRAQRHRDRTGLIAALLLALADAEPEAIARDYAVSSANLRDGYLKRYAEADPQRILEALRCPEEGAYNMLQFLAAAGGVRAYLAHIGLQEDEIERLRGRLR